MNIKAFSKPIYITKPLIPSFSQFQIRIKQIFHSRRLTNNGPQLQEFEQKLNKFLGVSNISVFCNGTLALQLACKALDLKGEVITTPFTFPATPHAISWNGLTSVFCDIEDKTFNINPDKIEELITEKTSAILPVHVFGNPCQVDKIKKIADKYNLKVIYDAAHAFGVKIKGIPIGNFGDISMFSFHTTKLFNTLEGGALTFYDKQLIKKLQFLKNFGIKNEEEVVSIGTNAKMNEIQAAFGILVLNKVQKEIKRRKYLTERYRQRLKGIKGIKVMNDMENVKHNYQYMPILVKEKEYGLSRDQFYKELKKYNIFSRKYFYPLCSHYPNYKKLNSAKRGDLCVAESVANQVLCLPLYGELKITDIDKICDIILFIKTNRRHV